MIRILHSVSNMDRAGVETMLMNYYRHMDREKVQFDFLANKPKIGDYEEEIKEMGGRIFRTPGYKSYNKYLKYMKKLFADHPEYKIIHTHNGSLMIYALKTAKECNIPVRIAHAHATAIPRDFKKPIKMCVKPFIKFAANHYWGCSDAAGEFYFTKKRWHNSDNQLIHNAIELDKFAYNEQSRARLREQYGLTDKFVIGNIGRFTWQKNHKKLIDVFYEIHKQNPDARLVLVGVGELENEMKAQISALNMTDAVVFTGLQTNVEEWYSVFDVFVMTSHYEGLPVVGIEAQASDLPCFFTDTITPEVKILEKTQFLGLNDEPKVWADAILSCNITKRESRYEEMKNAGYDIKTEAKRMEDMYIKLYSQQ